MASILIVDEHDNRLRCLQSALSPHKLVCTKNVPRALTALQTHQFDLLVAPVYLESGDVFTLVHSAAELSTGIRTVLLSLDRDNANRYATKPIQSAARFLGVHKYVLLEAPDAVTLREAIERCIPSDTLATLSREAGTIYEL
jgi:CheY-like chemotaxis protein